MPISDVIPTSRTIPPTSVGKVNLKDEVTSGPSLHKVSLDSLSPLTLTSAIFILGKDFWSASQNLYLPLTFLIKEITAGV